MLSFLVDERGFFGGARAAALSQGNAAPVAVSDTRAVFRGTGPVSVAVLSNDIDPEGGPLTLVSATAALGTAVAEADGTVTYTPPADAAVEFDTVVYEIADAGDARDTGQIDITISDPQVTVTRLSDETLEVSAAAAPVEITVTEPAEFAGSYTADLADLATGPVNLAPPRVSGTPAPGAVLDAVAGLWIHDADAGVPSRSWQWQRGGADIPGQTAASYTAVAGDDLLGVGVVETLTDAFGARSASDTASAGFLPSSDPQLTGWWDAADPATITDNGGAVSAWTDKSAGTALVQDFGARQPTTGIRQLNGLNVIDFDGADYLDQAVVLPASGDVAFHMVLAIDTTANEFEAVLAVDAVNDFQVDAGNTAQFDGRLNATGVGPGGPLTGGPFAGATILSVICDFTQTGTIEVFLGGVSRGVSAYTSPLDAAAALHVMTNRSKNASVNGAAAELVVTGDVANRAAYHSYLSQKWGLS